MSVSMYHVPTQRDHIPIAVNGTKIDVCVLLNTDLVVLPYLREFVYVEKYCPLNKVNECIFQYIFIIHI